MPAILRLMLVLGLFFATGGEGRDAHTSHYFWVMFGTQSGANTDLNLLHGDEFLREASISHTFGTFVEMRDGRVVRESTISWLPRPGFFGDGFAMPWFQTVPGHNYTLDETLRFVGGKNFRNFGPYEVSAELYQRGQRKIEFLNGAHTDYKMLGELGRNVRVPADYNQAGGAINCIMAWNGVGGFPDVGKVFGFRASELILSRAAATGYQVFDYQYGARRDVAEAMHLAERLRAHGIYHPLVFD